MKDVYTYNLDMWFKAKPRYNHVDTHWIERSMLIPALRLSRLFATLTFGIIQGT